MKVINGQNVVEVGERSRNDVYKIIETRWDGNGTLRVTVQDLYGWPANQLPRFTVAGMRRFATRALAGAKRTREVHRDHSSGCWWVTFAVTRLAD